MPIGQYKKKDFDSDNTYAYDDSHLSSLEINPFIDSRRKKSKLRLSQILTDSYLNLKDTVVNSGTAGIIIPGIFILLGLAFIYQQFFPKIQSLITEATDSFAKGNINIVSESYIDLRQYVSNPAGLDALTKEALSENILLEDQKSLEYSGGFFITVNSVGINRLPVEANVDSTTESVYNQVLNTRLAHFKSTGLPISDVKNNIVIYGHSASVNYGPQAADPYVAFSFLPDIQVGDEIAIEIEGKQYKFKMYESKIVNPDDTEIITGKKGKRTLTLFTCYPLGSNAQRYVVLAREA